MQVCFKISVGGKLTESILPSEQLIRATLKDSASVSFVVDVVFAPGLVVEKQRLDSTFEFEFDINVASDGDAIECDDRDRLVVSQV